MISFIIAKFICLIPVFSFAASLQMLWEDIVSWTFVKSNGTFSSSNVALHPYHFFCVSLKFTDFVMTIVFYGHIQALPQFGIQSTVRVCADCFNNSSRYTVQLDEILWDFRMLLIMKFEHRLWWFKHDLIYQFVTIEVYPHNLLTVH